MTANQQFSLKWTNYTSHITNAFDSLRSKEDFCDVTLSCEGRKIRAHKVLLSACSTYFKEIFKENPCQHPVIIFKNVKYDDLFAIVVYMYQGEVNIEQDALPSFLQTAEMLTVQGLTEDDDAAPVKQQNTMAQAATVAQSHTVAMKKEKIHTQTITVSKQQPISIITAPATTPLNQIIYSAITHAAPTQTPMLTDTIPIKRKRLASVAQSESYQETIPQATMAEVQSVSVDNDGDEYLKTESEMDISEYVTDAKQYRTDDDDDNEQIDIYETAQDDDDDEDANDKEKIATQAELGQLFTTTQTIDSKSPAAASQESTPGDASANKWSQCQYCKLVITTVNLWRHVRTQHQPQPPRQCEHCQKKFKNKYSLREHVRIAHEQKTS